MCIYILFFSQEFSVQANKTVTQLQWQLRANPDKIHPFPPTSDLSLSTLYPPCCFSPVCRLLERTGSLEGRCLSASFCEVGFGEVFQKGPFHLKTWSKEVQDRSGFDQKSHPLLSHTHTTLTASSPDRTQAAEKVGIKLILIWKGFRGKSCHCCALIVLKAWPS